MSYLASETTMRPKERWYDRIYPTHATGVAAAAVAVRNTAEHSPYFGTEQRGIHHQPHYVYPAALPPPIVHPTNRSDATPRALLVAQAVLHRDQAQRFSPPAQPARVPPSTARIQVPIFPRFDRSSSPQQQTPATTLNNVTGFQPLPLSPQLPLSRQQSPLGPSLEDLAAGTPMPKVAGREQSASKSPIQGGAQLKAAMQQFPNNGFEGAKKHLLRQCMQYDRNFEGTIPTETAVMILNEFIKESLNTTAVSSHSRGARISAVDVRRFVLSVNGKNIVDEASVPYAEMLGGLALSLKNEE